MNNIFKVIWNHATQTWTAVGELASAKGKSKSVKLAAILICTPKVGLNKPTIEVQIFYG